MVCCYIVNIYFIFYLFFFFILSVHLMITEQASACMIMDSHEGKIVTYTHSYTYRTLYIVHLHPINVNGAHHYKQCNAQTILLVLFAIFRSIALHILSNRPCHVIYGEWQRMKKCLSSFQNIIPNTMHQNSNTSITLNDLVKW